MAVAVFVVLAAAVFLRHVLLADDMHTLPDRPGMPQTDYRNSSAGILGVGQAAGEAEHSRAACIGLAADMRDGLDAASLSRMRFVRAEGKLAFGMDTPWDCMGRLSVEHRQRAKDCGLGRVDGVRMRVRIGDSLSR